MYVGAFGLQGIIPKRDVLTMQLDFIPVENTFNVRFLAIERSQSIFVTECASLCWHIVHWVSLVRWYVTSHMEHEEKWH